MDDTTATAESGTEQTSIDFGESQGEAGSSANQDSTDNQAGPDATHETDSAPRPLAELRKAFDAGEDISDEERDRILHAAKKGYKTDEEELEFLKTRPKKEGPKEAPKPLPKGEKPAEKAKDKEPLSDPLARLVKEINPTKPDPEEAFKSFQALRNDYRKKGERLSTLDSYAKQVGFDSIEAVFERATTMEARLEELLKTPEGLKQLLKAYEVPESVLGTAAPQAPARAPELQELDDEEFPQGGKIKSAMAKMAQDIEARIRSEFQAKYGDVEKHFGEIQTRIAREEGYRHVDDARDRAIRDVEAITRLANDNEIADWVLKDPAEKIFAESTYVTYKDGRKVYQTKKEPHPEWPVFEKLLEVRKERFLQSGAPKVSQWFGEMLLERGSFQKGKQDAAAQARADLLTKQRKSLQPTLVSKGKAQVTESFKVPESEEDIEAMTPEQKREFRRRLFSGELKVRNT